MRFYFDFGPHSYKNPRYVCFNVKNSTRLDHAIQRISHSNLHLAYTVVAITDKGPEWVKNRFKPVNRHNLLLDEEEIKEFNWQILASDTINL